MNISQLILNANFEEVTFDFKRIDEFLYGQFSAFFLKNKEFICVRDPLGICKLFYSQKKDEIIFSSNLYEFIEKDIHLNNIYSITPGEKCILKAGEDEKPNITFIQNKKNLDYFNDHLGNKDELKIKELIKYRIEKYFVNLETKFKDFKKVILLSGGLDSTVVAYNSSKYLSNIEFITCGVKHNLDSKYDLKSDDNDCKRAKEVAKELGVKISEFYLREEDVLNSLNNVIRLCCDWRDFNVHCASFNYEIAQYISRNFPQNTIVLTGDLMNEYFADYTEVIYENQIYYPQLKIKRSSRRRFFKRGLDTSNREIAIFENFNIKCFQPYSSLYDCYEKIGIENFEDKDFKYKFNQFLLPTRLKNLVGKAKTRAQNGDNHGGLLGVFHRNGINAETLKNLFCNIYKISIPDLNKFIIGGRYRDQK